jgi:hypothetical protein
VPAFQFYETTVLIGDEESGFRALNFLTSPAHPEGLPEPLSYEPLLEEARSVAASSLSVDFENLAVAAAAVGRYPDLLGAAEGFPAEAFFELTSRDLGIGLQAVALPLVPTESSRPLVKRTVTEIAVNGGTATLLFLAGGPVLLVVGGLGLVAIRAVGGALWEGARPELVEFGGDAMAAYLDSLRHALGISRRSDEDS